MPFCPRCGTEVVPAVRFCPNCGAEQSSLSQMATDPGMPTPDRRPVSAGPDAPIGRLDPHASTAPNRFRAGQVIAGRYRIIGLLGRGGMAEVYRADDLTLGQPVSLKFLPAALESDAHRLELLLAEVRNARQVAHPNVCRVYDIGEAEGRHFLCMEFVDGEDLSSLLRRIGRLPADKAGEVARQMCAGLAAAHDRGVLHRDLKPSNIMIDGDGRARITDFGLAVKQGASTAGEVSGTPAYMAPEQFRGEPATVQSDLYSMGLILHEIYTGKPVFQAGTFHEWESRHATSTPTSPSQAQQDIDPLVERAILRCLDKDPARRPASALRLAASLPGGDPMLAALAAGETPTPQMVAASGGEGALSPRAAWLLLGVVLTLTVAIIAISPYSTDLGLARTTRSEASLREGAKQMLSRLGYSAEPADAETWGSRFYEPMRYLADRKPSTTWRAEMRQWGPPVLLSYRQSPRALEPMNWTGRVVDDDPPFEYSGELMATVDATGRLWQFQAIPPQLDSTPPAAAPPHWDALFTEAGLERAKFTEVTPLWVPPSAFDARAEWTGMAPWDSGIPLRVSAAAWRGKPVYFAVLGPWSKPLRMVQGVVERQQRLGATLFAVLVLLLLIICVYFSRRNLMLGRGDRRGATKIAIYAALTWMLAWLFDGHHPGEFGSGFWVFYINLAEAVMAGLIFGFLYIAFEPQVRKRIPELLISWSRLLQGRFTDPRVGRDLLQGAALGALYALCAHLGSALPSWFPIGRQTPVPASIDLLGGGLTTAGGLIRALGTSALVAPMGMMGIFFLFFLLLRRRVLAAAAMGLFMALMTYGPENPGIAIPASLLLGGLYAFSTARLGLVTTLAFTVFERGLLDAPLPLDLASPHGTTAVVCLAVFLGIAVYAFRISLGRRAVFGAGLEG